LIRIFFRRIEVEGLEGLPARGPAVLVANHINGLVDALLLMATLPRFPRFLGKSTLFRILPLWPFLKLAGVVPVYRAKDGESTARNESSFRTCRLLLAHGALVALFPEGISHDESMLQPLKTGAARIALGAAVDDAVPGVAIVPVGLSYDAKATFRSRALVQVGVPQPVDGWADRYRTDGHRAVRDLTAEMAGRLSTVSPTYRSWMQATEFRQIAEVVAGTADVELGRREATARMFAEADASGHQDAELAVLHGAFTEYERDLALIGRTDEQVCGRDGPGRRRIALGWVIGRVLVALPAAAVGTVVHVVPYRIMKRLGSLPDNESMKATVKLVGCFVLFTLVYVILGVVISETWGPWAGLGAALLAPACGYAAVRLAERVKRIGGVMAGARVVRQRRAVPDTVLVHRAAVLDAARRVLAGCPDPGLG